MSENPKLQIKVLCALTLVHFTGDFYSSFTSPLFPLFIERLGLSLAQVGLIAGANRFLAFVVQPCIGYLSDRYATRLFMITGLLLAVVFIPLTGLASGFWVLMLTIACGSIGSSMFHPSITGMVPLYSGRSAGFAMSVFNTGGTLAFGLGPLFITWYASRMGLGALPFTMVLGLLAAVGIFPLIPVPQSEGMHSLGFFGSIRESLGSAWKIVALIWLVMVARATVSQSFATFLPIMCVQKGYSVVSAGLVFSLFTIAGTFSGLLAGHTADRIGFRKVFLFTHALMAPVLLWLLKLQGPWIYLGAVLGGAFVLASLPLGVTLAQQIAPRGRSIVSSLMMGLAWGVGGLISPLVGKVADLYSIQTALTIISLLPLVTLPLIWAFPHRIPQKAPEIVRAG